jgi:hypothetical protein
MIANVINLDHRKDKWQLVFNELSPHFNINRISAIKHDWGWLGLARTYKQIFKEATGDVLIFEDDATYRGTVTDLTNAIADLPQGWEMLMLGANIKNPSMDRISKNVARTYGAWTTHAIYYSYGLCQEMASINLDVPIDEYYRTIVQPRGNSYVVYPFLSFQRASISDIEGDYKDYSKLFTDSEERTRSFIEI